MKGLGGVVVLLLGLAALAFAVKMALSSTTAKDSAQQATDGIEMTPGRPNASPSTRPKQQLDNVRARTKELEKEMQRQADDVVKKAAEQ
jgi:TolA-binding protein